MNSKERNGIYEQYIVPIEQYCEKRYDNLTSLEINTYLKARHIQTGSAVYRLIEQFFHNSGVQCAFFETSKENPDQASRPPSLQKTNTVINRSAPSFAKKDARKAESIFQEKRFIEEMTLANFTMKTRKSYLAALRIAQQWCVQNHQKGIHDLDHETARAFFLFLLATRKFSQSTYNLYRSAIRFYLEKAISIRLDEPTIDYFKEMAEETGIPYQNLINLYLRDCAENHKKLKIKWAS